MSLSWEALQTALVSWVSGSAGLGAGKVVWGDQNGVKLARPFITLRFATLTPLGATDEKRYTTSGSTMTETVIGRREATLTVQAFVEPTVGSSAAMAVLGRVATALRQTSVRNALNAAGFSPFDPGAIQNLSARLDADFEGRALFPLRGYVTEEVAAAIDWFDQVQATGYTGVGGDLGTKDEIDI